MRSEYGGLIFNRNKLQKINVLPVHKNLILSFLDEIEPSIHTNHGVRIDPKRTTVDDPTEEEYEKQAMIDDWIEFGQYEFKPFAFGVKVEHRIYWLLLYTNHTTTKSENVNYDLGVRHISITRNKSITLWRVSTQSIDSSMFLVVVACAII